MNVLIIGNETEAQRFRERFGLGHQLKLFKEDEALGVQPDLVFWFRTLDNPLPEKLRLETFPLFADCTLTSISKLRLNYSSLTGKIIGFTSLQGFFERSIFEVSIENNGDSSRIKLLMEQLETDFEIVKDQIGLVSPRIVAMIINEAFHTAGEGTATREDIDVAMKLGTNYPKGPFEWTNELGGKNIFNLLNALFLETGDTRYRPAELLTKEYAN